jgi:hypothetical protein
MANDLSLVPTEEMINELQKRFDHIVFTALKIQDSRNNYIALRRFNGHRIVCIGILDLMKKIILDIEIASSVHLKGEV